MLCVCVCVDVKYIHVCKYFTILLNVLEIARNLQLSLYLPCVCVYIYTGPSGPPELLDQNVTFLGSGNVNISWPRPDGPVHGYLLFYSLSSDPGSEVVINITSPSTTHAVLLGLQAGASYDISVLAFADLPTERSDTLVLTLNGKMKEPIPCFF